MQGSSPAVYSPADRSGAVRVPRESCSHAALLPWANGSGGPCLAAGGPGPEDVGCAHPEKPCGGVPVPISDKPVEREHFVKRRQLTRKTVSCSLPAGRAGQPVSRLWPRAQVAVHLAVQMNVIGARPGPLVYRSLAVLSSGEQKTIYCLALIGEFPDPSASCGPVTPCPQHRLHALPWPAGLRASALPSPAWNILPQGALRPDHPQRSLQTSRVK